MGPVAVGVSLGVLRSCPPPSEHLQLRSGEVGWWMEWRTHSFVGVGELVLGCNSIHALPEVLAKEGARRVLLLADAALKEAGLLEKPLRLTAEAGVEVGLALGANREPTAELVDSLAEETGPGSYDLLIGMGGGSVLDTAKLLAVKATNPQPVVGLVGIGNVAVAGIPTVLVPTTAGTGSEVTPNAIVTLEDRKLKQAVVSPYLYARYAIVDPVLTMTLPPKVTAFTGMDALIHALESYISRRANPISDAYAWRALRLIGRSLLRAYNDGDLAARSDMLFGASLAGLSLSSAGTAAVHALAYPLGGQYGIAHGLANALLLTPVLRFSLPVIAKRLTEVAEALGWVGASSSPAATAEDVVQRMEQLVLDLRIPQKLTELGISTADPAELAAAASQVTRLLDNNPRQMTTEQIEEIYRQIL